MSAYISANERTRIKRLEGELETVHAILNESVTQAALGAIATSRLLYINQHIYVPNIRHGEVKLPNNLDEEGIVLLSALPGESITIPAETTASHPLQHDIMRSIFSQVIADEATVSSVLEKSDEFFTKTGNYPTTMPERVGGYIPTRSWRMEMEGVPQLSISPRPVIVLNDANLYNRPLVHVHEYTHAADMLTGPIEFHHSGDPFLDSHRTEFNAYNNEATLLKVMMDNPLKPAFSGVDVHYYRSQAPQITAIRKKYHARHKDKFEPTYELVNQITDAVGEIVLP